MNTNHNRIKVSDLETDDPDKILVTNSNGELEFIATKNIKVDSYNALDYDQEGKALDARQGKILKDLVNNKIDKGGFQGTAQDLANSIPDLNSSNLKLGSYPSTRNDGELSTNKVLSTDASGNLKLYSFPKSPTYPAPYLTEILPYSFLPNTTGNIILKGSFFTPNMTVVIQGQTVNHLEFKSDNEVNVNVTTGSAEGSFDVTLNNGISATFPNALLIVLGVVYTPTESNYSELSNPPIFKAGEMLIKATNIFHDCTLDFIIPLNKDFRFQYTPVRSPLYPFGEADYYGGTGSIFYIKDLTLDVDRFNILPRVYENSESGGNGGNDLINSEFNGSGFTLDATHTFERKNGVFKWYHNGIYFGTYTATSQNSLQFIFRLKNIDLKDVKYIELAT